MHSHSRTRFRRRRLASATNYKVQTVALSQPDPLHRSLNLHITRITHRNIEKTPRRALPSSLTHSSTGIVAVACWHSIPYRTPPYPHRTFKGARCGYEYDGPTPGSVGGWRDQGPQRRTKGHGGRRSRRFCRARRAYTAWTVGWS